MAQQNQALDYYEEFVLASFQRLVSKAQNYAVGLDQDGQLRRAYTHISHGQFNQVLVLFLISLKGRIYETADVFCHPFLLSRDPIYQLWSICQTLFQIDTILDQINALITAPIWTPTQPLHISSNKDSSTMSGFSSSVKEKVLAVFKQLARHFSLYYIRLPLSEDSKNQIEIRNSLKSSVRYVGQCIEVAVDQFSRTEIRTFQSMWQSLVSKMDETLSYTAEALTQEANSPQAVRIQQLYREAILMIKLSRLLLNKMSKPTNSEAHPISRMSSRYHIALMQSTHMLAYDINDYVQSIGIFDPHPDTFNQEPAENIEAAVAETLKIINSFLDGQDSETSNQHSNQRWKDWYKRWREAFDMAAERFQATLEAIHM
ncbi:hypothetical protein PtB15_1B928 [Puccinia triticina]|nr:hypothetical protein PtB15_1B928 [Puccinia triticina]